MCGEQTSVPPPVSVGSGSPPRVRGTALPGVTQTPRERITPACAGNSSRVNCVIPKCKDHPRVCGEQMSMTREEAIAVGSPPRVRGTVRPGPRRAAHSRITPACAGNRNMIPLSSVPQKDHPRVCGEQAPGASTVPVTRGSPPRVRGTGREALDSNLQQRITPACAGNSAICLASASVSPDHPRVCGEQQPTRVNSPYRGGSPPRVRGTGTKTAAAALRCRITPACAGNSPCRHICTIINQDHPRVCGEQVWVM